MNKTLKQILWIAGSIFLVAGILAVTMAQLRPSGEMPLEYREKVSRLVTNYSMLQKSLAADNLNQARQASHDLSTNLAEMRIHESQVREITPVQQAWSEGLNDLYADVNVVDSGIDLGTLAGIRRYFLKVSTAMIPFTERFGNAHLQPMYVMHCSMAFENKGASWLQTSDKLRNPYFGKEMLECGEILKVILPGEK